MPEEPPAPVRRRDVDRIPRGLWVRILVYGVIGHVLAAFLFLLFALAP
ncbi:DUF6126 family protein [Streptomyces sp. RFCAC02]|nr:DUF6126 family protein [Streptomyces sp. RFCAC02]